MVLKADLRMSSSAKHLPELPGAALQVEGCWPVCAEVMSVAVPGHCVAPWIKVLGLGAGILERAAAFRRENFSLFTYMPVVSISFHRWCVGSKHKDGKGKVKSAGKEFSLWMLFA